MKEQLRGDGVIPIGEKCSAIIKQKIVVLEKLQDPKSCTFSYSVECVHFDKAICDLGSGISLMPMSVAIAYDIYGDLKTIRISIQLETSRL